MNESNKNIFNIMKNEITCDGDILSDIVKLFYKKKNTRVPKIMICDSPIECQSYNSKKPIEPFSDILKDINISSISKEISKNTDEIQSIISRIKMIRDIPIKTIYNNEEVRYRFSERLDISDSILLYIYMLSEIKCGIYDEFLAEYYRQFLSSIPYCSVHYKDLCAVSKPPVHIHTNIFGELHNIDCMAIEWADKYGQYYINGSYVDENIFHDIKNGNMSIDDILNMKKIDQQAMIALYGADKLIQDGIGERGDSRTVDNKKFSLWDIHGHTFVDIFDKDDDNRQYIPISYRSFIDTDNIDEVSEWLLKFL